jgi:pilus biogenesis lipoprotein CpaD
MKMFPFVPRILALAGIGVLAACTNPVVDQAARDLRHEPVRSDTMLALDFAPGSLRLDGGQVLALRAMAAEGRRAQRDEFVVVSDGSGGAIQQARAQQARNALADAGVRWVETAVQPAMVTGPNSLVVVRSEYRIAFRNCPNFGRTNTMNTNEAVTPNFGCGDAYNFGQMLARPRDAFEGRDPGPADGTVNAEAILRYREGRVRTVTQGTTAGTNAGQGGGAGGGTTGGGSSGAGGGVI